MRGMSGTPHLVEFMSYAVSGDCQYAGVAEDDFFVAHCCGVAAISCLYVAAKFRANHRQLLKKITHNNMRPFLAYVLWALADFSADVLEALLYLTS